MFENLSSKITSAMRTLKGNGRITDVNVAATVKEIRRALMDADVNYKVAKEITDRIKEQALGQKILISVEPGQLLVKIVHEELTQLMGGVKQDINLKGDPAVVLIAGLQGSGKTTFSGKLAQYIKKGGRNVLLVACDIYRPAAIDQLKVLGEQVGVEVYAEPENKSAVSIAENALSYARKMGKKVVIVDTAGRLAIDESMMNEIEAVKKAINPTEILFVVDSMTGQDAVNTAKTFNERLNFDGVVLTKLDGDSRGGAALSIRQVVEKPIKFISTGEKMEALDQFYPDRMANRILGMGDVLSLVERAQQAFDEDEAARLNKKIRQNNF
jgi:signal recognition particle subunit SRP54